MVAASNAADEGGGNRAEKHCGMADFGCDGREPLARLVKGKLMALATSTGSVIDQRQRPEASAHIDRRQRLEASAFGSH